jgi:hypothetical protein
MKKKANEYATFENLTRQIAGGWRSLETEGNRGDNGTFCSVATPPRPRRFPLTPKVFEQRAHSN